MKNLNYYIVDVFSIGKYTGNQLAVFKNASNISENEMQQIAKEINFSETTFITSDLKDDNSFDVRIFTPNEEVPFAGHPALGTVSIIQSEILKIPVENLILNFKAGPITVSFNQEDDVIWMKQNEPIFGSTLDVNVMAEILTIDSTYIDDRFPIQEVSTGLPSIIVPLKTLEAVEKVKINKEKYFELIKHTIAKSILVFAPEAYHSDNDINVRDFAEYYGIPEDAATGSSNGCLASYLVKYNYFLKKEINFRVEQGYEINRPSLLYLKANEDNEKINVFVGGKVTKIAQGEWLFGNDHMIW